MLKELRCLIKPVSIAILALGTCSQAAAEFRLHPYAAVNAGAVRLAPDPGSSGLELTEANTFGFNLLLGLDIFDRWALEAGYTDLGSATLRSPSLGDQEIGYTAYSFSTLFHLFGDARDIAERDGAWTYLRLGLNQISNESDLELEKADNTAIWAGIGFEWAFSSMLSLRGEVASFDGDAQALTAGIVLRPFDGVSSRSRPNIVRPQPAPVPSTKPVPVPKPAVVPTPEVQIEKPQRLPIPNNPAPNATPEVLLVGCENPVIGEPVGTDGCARLTGVRRGLQFVGSTAQLTPDSARAVTALADALLSAPNLKVEIRAHAQSGQGPSASQTLSKQRAVAVARALVGAGVQVSRLGARAFGDKEPVVKTGSSAGEMLPNRIEFVVQP